MFNNNSLNSFKSKWKSSLRFPLLVIVIVSLFLPPAGLIVFAQQANAPWYEVRSIYTSDYAVSNPGGLAFSTTANAFLVWDASGNVTGIGLKEDPVDTQSLNIPVENPQNIAFNGYTNSLFVLNSGDTQLEEFSVNNKGLPEPATGPSRSYNFQAVNLSAARGLAFDQDTGRMFILNQKGNQVVIVTPTPAAGFDGDAAVREGRVKRINLNKLGYANLQGIAYNPNDDDLYLLDAANQKVYQITQAGKEVSVYDVSSLQLAQPATMLFAPSGDATDDPAKMNMFVLDSGTQSTSASTEQTPQTQTTSVSGQIAELSLTVAASLPAGTTLLPATLVKTVDTSKAAWNPSAPDPAGVDYWPLTGRLLISDSEVDEMPAYFTGDNIYSATTSGTLVSTCSTTNINRTGFSNEPTGLAINPANNRVYISDDNLKKIFEVSLGPDGIYCTGDDVVTSVGLATDTEDVAYGNNTIFIAGGVDAEVYEFSLGPNGVLGGGDDGPVTHWDTASLGFNDLEGIGYNADNGTLFIVSTQGSDKYLGETTTSGTLLRAYDLSLMGSGSNIRSDVAYAPSSLNPAVKDIYIVSRGVDNGADPNENDGRWWEISIGPAQATLTPSNTPAITNTPTNTPTPSATATITPTPNLTTNPLYISMAGSGTVAGVAFDDEDILRFDGSTWSLFFDGSDVGVASPDTTAFAMLDANTFLFVFSGTVTLNGISFTQQDIARFDATSTGSITAGTFSMYLNGIDVGLDSSSDNIDALSLLPDGRVLISTTGSATVPGLSGLRDEDVLAFTPTSLGANTSGTWAMYLDGSDVGLADASTEDVDALDVASNGDVYLSTLGAFSVPGVSGAGNDIFICSPTSLGSTTACTYSPSLYFVGSAWGLGSNNVDALNLPASGPSPTATAGPSPTSSPSPTSTPTSTPTLTSTPGPSPTQSGSDLIFADSFESGSFSAWSSSSTGGGDLSVAPAAALVGSLGMQSVINDTTSMYVTDNSPNLEPRYRARFYFDPNSITMANSDMFTLFYGFSGSTSVLRVDFRYSSGVYQLMARALDDGTTWTATPWFTISDAPHSIEFDWQASTAVGANDGTLAFWIDGTQQASLTGIDDDTRRIDTIRFGDVTGLDAGTLGTVYFDAFESHRQNYIGP